MTLFVGTVDAVVAHVQTKLIAFLYGVIWLPESAEFIYLWTAILQIMIWWAGLMRGAVSIALAFNQVRISLILW